MNNLNDVTSLDVLPSVLAVDAPFDVTDGAPTPFGKRWGGEVFCLTAAQLDALRSGQTLALDVMGEFVIFLQTAPHLDPVPAATNSNFP
jgi:hypothetical protein